MTESESGTEISRQEERRLKDWKKKLNLSKDFEESWRRREVTAYLPYWYRPIDASRYEDIASQSVTKILDGTANTTNDDNVKRAIDFSQEDEPVLPSDNKKDQTSYLMEQFWADLGVK